ATGALLGGNGTLGSVSLVKGTLGPGDGSLSTLNTGSLTWSAVATMTFDLSSNSTLSDKILLNGNFTKSGTGNFTFNFIGGQASTTYTLVSWSGNTTFTAGNFTASGQTGSFAIAAKELQFTVIPEPSVVFLFLGGVAALIALHFNRKQKSPFTPDHTARSDDPGRSSSKPNKGSGLRITETCKKKENPPWRGSAL
ncbi:MAG: hypothetical protein WCG52_10585, partial [bacterium]